MRGLGSQRRLSGSCSVVLSHNDEIAGKNVFLAHRFAFDAQAEVLAEYQKDAPIGRLIRPEEVAAAVLYLCSPDAAAVTGTTLAVAGGEV